MKRSAKLIIGDREYDQPTVPAWQRSNGQYIAGHAELDGTDKAATDAEHKWGCGRLRLLVDPALREKFDRQRYLLNQAVWHGDLEAVRTQAKRMRAAWAALDKAATDAGRAPQPPTVWEVVLDDGSVAAVVQTDHDASQVIAEGRGMAVYTLAEIGRLLSGFPAIAKAKQTWDGASVVAVRQVGDPLDGIHDTRPTLDDALPF